MTHVNVLCAGAVKAAFVKLVTRFERDTGHSVTCTFAAVGTLLRQYEAGAATDFLLLNRPAMDRLVSGSKVLPSLIDVGTVGVAIAVRSGVTSPDVSTAESLRAALLDSPSLSYGDPGHGDSSGVHFAKVIAQLGITDRVAAKTRLATSGHEVAELVRDGHVAIGATQASVIATCPGVVLAGLLPDDLQQFTSYVCGCSADTRASQAAAQLLDFMRTDGARQVFEQAGFAVESARPPQRTAP
jgi:molybdate transport system substrate-binding protein